MFCSNCGAEVGNANFCRNCGAKTGSAPCDHSAQVQDAAREQDEMILWEGQPAGIGDRAKGVFNSVYYRVTSERIFITSGLIGKNETEIELRRLQDVQVTQTVAEKISGVGDITIVSTDALDGVLVLNNVYDPITVKEIIREAAAKVRRRMDVRYGEVM